MANVQVFPSTTAQLTITIQGRKYTGVVGGTPLIVPDFDAFVLVANGWLRSAKDGAGTTAQRPINPQRGAEYYDSTVGAKVIWNGGSWVNHATGTAA